jgi:hypothetical protein
VEELIKSLIFQIPETKISIVFPQYKKKPQHGKFYYTT